MRLTIINQFYRPDVAPTAALAESLARHRAALGDQVTVITGRGGYTGGDGASGSATSNPRVVRLWTPGFGKQSHVRRVADYAAFYALAAWRLAAMPRQDVIVSLTTPPLIARAAALHTQLRRGSKLILWNMDCYPDAAERAGVMKPGGAVARAVHAVNRGIFRRLSHLVCLDTAMARLLCGHYATVNPGLPVSIIPNWEDLAFFPADARPDPWPGASALGLHGKFVVLYLGNMGYGHEFGTALDAAEKLRGEPAVFLFIGGGKRAEWVGSEIKRRGLSNVILHGYVPKEQTPSVMTCASAALVTLLDEAVGVMSPSKIHANLAAGLPLIYVGGAGSNVDDAVSRHGCGVSLRIGDADGLAAYVRGMIRDPARLRAERARARATFEAAYCDRATLPLFDAAIEQAVRGHAWAHTAIDYARFEPAAETQSPGPEERPPQNLHEVAA